MFVQVKFSIQSLCACPHFFCGNYHKMSLILNLEFKRYWFSCSRFIVAFFVLAKFWSTAHTIMHSVYTLHMNFRFKPKC